MRRGELSSFLKLIQVSVYSLSSFIQIVKLRPFNRRNRDCKHFVTPKRQEYSLPIHVTKRPRSETLLLSLAFRTGKMHT